MTALSQDVCGLCSAVVRDIEAHRDFHWQAGQWPRCREPHPEYADECVLRRYHLGQHFVDTGTFERVPGTPLVRPTGEHWWPEETAV